MTGPASEHAWTAERATELDRLDSIGHLRDRFVLPEGVIYLDGNSLGPMPRTAPQAIRAVAEGEWASRLIAGWGEAGWMEAPERVGDLIAPLIGATAGEVIVADTTTLALVKVLVAARNARPDRRVIVTTPTNFPTDLYAMEAAAALLGDLEIRQVPPPDLITALTPEVAALALTHVDFRTGEMFDLPRLTAAAHDAGALAIWDLCHSAGAVPVGVGEHEVDLAVGCGYKFLNGGPGAPSYIYVRRALHGELANPLPGWLGHEAPFEFGPQFRPAAGIRQWLTSTPPILGLAALEAALECFDGATIEAVRAKSVSLTTLFIEAVAERQPDAFELASPQEAGRRGSQVSLRHRNAEQLITDLAAGGVVGDFRGPDICRFGFGAPYLTHAEVLVAAEAVAAAG